MLALILENKHLPCFIDIFLNKIVLETKILFYFLKLFSLSGIGLEAMLM